MNKNQKGFSAVEGLLILIIVGIIGGAGWFVYNSNKKSNDSLKNADASSKIETKNGITTNSKLDKEYKNNAAHLSFKYPSSWKLEEDLSNSRGAGIEGQIRVTSPAGLKVVFGPDAGGKGGDCEPAPNDTPHKSQCPTLEILSKEKVSIPNAKGAYLIRYKFTGGKDEAGKYLPSEFGVDLDYNEFVISTKEPLMGLWTPRGEVIPTNENVLPVETYIESKNNSNQSFLDDTDVKTAEAIFKSFKFL